MEWTDLGISGLWTLSLARDSELAFETELSLDRPLLLSFDLLGDESLIDRLHLDLEVLEAVIR